MFDDVCFTVFSLAKWLFIYSLDSCLDFNPNKNYRRLTIFLSDLTQLCKATMHNCNCTIAKTNNKAASAM